MFIAIVRNWVISQVYCSLTIKLSLRSIAEVHGNAFGADQIGPGSYCFFVDPDPVLLEDVDPDQIRI